MASTYQGAIGAQLPHILRSAVAVRAGRAPRPRPTGSKVHSGPQLYVGEEGSWWQPTLPRIARRIVRAAIRFDQRTRQTERRDRTGRRRGALGHVAINVLETLLSLLNFKTGELFPAVATIATRTGHCISAVHAGLKRLAAHGFVEWRRRVEPTGEKGVRGPQVKQASNAYRLKVPAGMEAEVYPPAPEDDLWRRQEAAQEHCRMATQEKVIVDAMRPQDAVRAIMGSDTASPLGRSLLSLARSFEQRDFAKRNESPKSF